MSSLTVLLPRTMSFISTSATSLGRTRVLNWASVKVLSKLVFPTPMSPTMVILKKKSYLAVFAIPILI